ncbi:MAG: hypothetical protein ACM3MD_03120 [Betaproteobacteria bacterium]
MAQCSMRRTRRGRTFLWFYDQCAWGSHFCRQTDMPLVLNAAYRHIAQSLLLERCKAPDRREQFLEFLEVERLRAVALDCSAALLLAMPARS